jgi:hypothetical protein
LAEIWRTQDRLGREVFFSPAGRNHILRKHDDMASRLSSVRTTIEQATAITRDLKYRRRENHYWQTAPGKTWINVVVQYRPVPPQGTCEGEIITAHRVKEPDPQEEPRSL